MFAVPSEPYDIDPDFVNALNLLFIVHADHEQMQALPRMG